MKLLTPAGSVTSFKEQIEKGSDEIYIGVDTDWGGNLSFSARGRYNKSGEKILFDLEVVPHLLSIANQHNVEVNVVINSSFNQSFLSAKNDEYNLNKYVDQLTEVGVKNFIVSDFGVLKQISKWTNNAFITSSNIFETNNEESVRIAQDLGANRVVLPYQITLSEIEYIRKKNSLIEIEVFGHYGCSFHDGFCTLKHNVGEQGNCGINVGTPCRNYYDLKGHVGLGTRQWLNYSKVCSLCQIKPLIDLGVNVIKIVGREYSGQNTQILTSIYREEIDRSLNRPNKDWDSTINLPKWWKKGICTSSNCKYDQSAETNGVIIGLPTQTCFVNRKKYSIPFSMEQNVKADVNEVWLKDINQMIPLDPEVRYIGIGFEYCSEILKHTEVVLNKINEIQSAGKTPVVITPNIKSRELDKISENLETILKSFPQTEVVFNDIGLLSRMSRTISKNGPSGFWWAGRLLVRSGADWPWIDHILRDESSQVKELILQNGISTIYLELLMSLKIDGVELNQNEVDLEVFEQRNLLKKLHVNTKLLAVARHCLNCKLVSEVPSLETHCNVHSLELKGLESSLGPLENGLDAIYPTLQVKGAGVFSVNNFQNNKIKNFDRYTFMSGLED